MKTAINGCKGLVVGIANEDSVALIVDGTTPCDSVARDVSTRTHEAMALPPSPCGGTATCETISEKKD